MSAEGLARLAGLLADPTRAAMCLALLDGRTWTAGELARHAAVAAPTATGHLHKLIDAGLLVEQRQGRHRYVRLAGPEVAELLEGLSSYAGPAPVRSLKAANVSAVLAAGRTCYDHLAGRLGVAVTDAMSRQRLLDQRNGFALTDAGVAWFDTALGVDLEALRGSRRPLARSCVDWTERRPHLAGLAGARICTRMFEREWVTRVAGTRAVRLTPPGRTALRDLLGIVPAAA